VNVSPTSLRQRLVLGAIAVGVTFAVVFGLAATWRVHHAQDRAIHAELMSRLDLARDEVGPDGTLQQDAGSPKTDLVQVVAPDGTVRSSSPALAGIGPLVDVADVRRSPNGLERRLTLQRPDVDLAVRAVPLRTMATDGSTTQTGALVVAVDTEGFNAAGSDLLGLLVVGLVAVVATLAALSWVSTGRALRSVTRLTERAETAGPQDLATGLPVPHRDAELTRLVGALNRMLARIDESHAAELAFAANAGHRLRTPIATLRAEAELALREPDPREQSAALERILRDADQLASIVDRMLARSRGHAYEPAGVAAAIHEAERRWRRQAELADATFLLKVADSVTAHTRTGALIETIEPLLENAFRHTPRGGVIRVDVGADPAGQVVADVSNTGAPIPPDLADRIFDAWVSTRDASEAGGLGLWLARETARDVGGDVTLRNCASPGATTFRIVLPAVHWVDRAD
jgi:signal transduction histidine kinase